MSKVWIIALLLACGPTVGDPCTTPADCLSQTCFQDAWAPGGYCSLGCKLEDPTACPQGTTCIRGAHAGGGGACLRVCRSPNDCRQGYGCQTVRESASPVCVGPAGL